MRDEDKDKKRIDRTQDERQETRDEDKWSIGY